MNHVTKKAERSLFHPRATKTGAAVCAALAAATVVGAALATPGAGVITAPVVARGAFLDSTNFKIKVAGHDGNGQEVLHVPNAQDTVVQQIKIAPSGTTGWHSHPGPVIVVVQAGALTLYSSDDPMCTGHTYIAGQAFIDSGQGHVHIAYNHTSEDLELWATYLDVPAGAPFRNDAPDPGTCVF
jgi:quercetin dioxygenase-like cupin family protein